MANQRKKIVPRGNAAKTPPKSSAPKKGGKGKFFPLVKKWTIRMVLFFFISTISITLLYRFVDPPFTPLMVIRSVNQMLKGDKIRWKHTWVDLDEMSSFMPKAALASEDQKFYEHNGFDFEAIGKAFERNQHSRKIRGGSTISQQTAKNVFLWAGRSWLRKGLEAYFTVLIETCWSKKRILEVYLNIIEMGRGVYGAEAAAQYYYHKSCRKLIKPEAAAIASVFPLPLKWSPVRPSEYIVRKQLWIIRQMDHGF